MTNKRSTDELIDEVMASKLAEAYTKEFKADDFMYICTWDGLDFSEDDYRVGMLLCVEGSDVDSVFKRATKVAVDVGAKWLPVRFTYDYDPDEKMPEGVENTPQISWIQWVNDPNEQATVDWINKQISEHKSG
jgi:hypothetical protein